MGWQEHQIGNGAWLVAILTCGRASARPSDRREAPTGQDSPTFRALLVGLDLSALPVWWASTIGRAEHDDDLVWPRCVGNGEINREKVGLAPFLFSRLCSSGKVIKQPAAPRLLVKGRNAVASTVFRNSFPN